MCEGDGRGGMRLNNIPTTSRVQAGDGVESAGIDGIYPRGVPIGRVSSVSRGASLFLEIHVTPTASFSESDGRARAGAVAGCNGHPGRSAECDAVKWKRLAGLFLAATAVQFLLGGSRHRSLWPIDAFLIATALVARAGDSVSAVLVGGAMGLFEDALSNDLLGMNAFAKAALGYVLALLSLRVMFGGIWAVGAALAAASLANDADRGSPVLASPPGSARALFPRGVVEGGGHRRHGRPARSRRARSGGGSGGRSGA